MYFYVIKLRSVENLHLVALNNYASVSRVVRGSKGNQFTEKLWVESLGIEEWWRQSVGSCEQLFSLKIQTFVLVMQGLRWRSFPVIDVRCLSGGILDTHEVSVVVLLWWCRWKTMACQCLTASLDTRYRWLLFSCIDGRRPTIV